MNNGILALAVAPAFAAPLLVQAQSSNVQIYGTINMSYEVVQAGGASPAAVLAPGQLGATPTGVNVPTYPLSCSGMPRHGTYPSSGCVWRLPDYLARLAWW